MESGSENRAVAYEAVVVGLIGVVCLVAFDQVHVAYWLVLVSVPKCQLVDPFTADFSSLRVLPRYCDCIT